MKKSIFSILFVFALSSFFANMAFAGEPIPGVDVKAGRNPCCPDQIKTSTDSTGRFNLPVDKKGSFAIIMSYDKIIEMIGRIDKNKASHKNGYIITLTLDGGANNKNTLGNGTGMPVSLVITKTSKVITINVPADGGIISGRLTYEPVKTKGEK